MTILIDSGASYNFATKASVARNIILYAKALEDSKSNSSVSVRLATGSIVSTRKVLLPLTPTTQGVRAGSAVTKEGGAVGVRSATQGDRAGAPTTQDVRAGSAIAKEGGAVGDRSATAVVDAITGERKMQLLTPTPTLSELLELEELSYVEFLEALKAGELEDLVLLRREYESVDLNSSSVMDPDVVEEERVSKRQRRYGAAPGHSACPACRPP